MSAKVGIVQNVRSTNDILGQTQTRVIIGATPMTVQQNLVEVEQSKVFTSKEDRSKGYILHPASSHESNFVYKSREKREAKEQITEALRQNKVP